RRQDRAVLPVRCLPAGGPGPLAALEEFALRPSRPGARKQRLRDAIPEVCERIIGSRRPAVWRLAGSHLFGVAHGNVLTRWTGFGYEVVTAAISRFTCFAASVSLVAHAHTHHRHLR